MSKWGYPYINVIKRMNILLERKPALKETVSSKSVDYEFSKFGVRFVPCYECRMISGSCYGGALKLQEVICSGKGFLNLDYSVKLLTMQAFSVSGNWIVNLVFQ